MDFKALKNTMLRQLRQLCARPMLWVMMVLVPIGCTLFFLSLMDEGLPKKVPSGMIDNDHSSLSRSITRQLSAGELVDITSDYESYASAMTDVRSGKIFGFFVIPMDFQQDVFAGRTPTLEYYSNMTYFVPGTLAFKGFKTVAVTSAGGVLKATLTSTGITGETTDALLQPVVIDATGIGNPWTNYTYYLTPSFMIALLALMVMLVTVYTITGEIKHDTSREWLATAGGNIWTALAGKLLPQTFIFWLTGLAMGAIMFGYNHFPMAGNIWGMAFGLFLFVPASQGFGLLVCSLIPNPRLALSGVSLLGILTFSFAGFSFPVEDMYGAIGIFAYLVPTRYYFLIYINTALNGFPLYYVRWCFVALAMFLPLALIFVPKLKKALLNPVYVP